MELSEMNMADVVARLAELDVEVREMQDVEAVEKATEEKKALLERKAELENLEQRKAAAEALTAGKAEAKVIEERKENKMEIEMRNTPEYGKAFVKMVMTGDDAEVRSLLSENANGVVMVPELLETEIKNAWADCQIMSLVKKTNYKGNVKVGFEVSATGAVIHTEGTAAPEEEVLTWGSVELKAESIKKWITISDEAIDGTTIDTLGEIYKEIAQRIAEKAEQLIIAKIVAAPATTDATHCGVPVSAISALAVDTIINAEALLAGSAKRLNIAMNRQTYAALVAVALNANYAVDVFDGLKDKVVFTDALPAMGAAESGDTVIIVGDFGYGFQANFPSGNDMKLIVDEKSLAEKDLVKIVGRQYVGMGVVAPKAFVKVTIA